MFIVSTNCIVNVDQVLSIYVDKPNIMVQTQRGSFPIYKKCGDVKQLDYVYSKIVEHITNNKNCYINDIVQEYNSQNGG